jgi:eukaryotic-like serine/threonine-protein kinase
MTGRLFGSYELQELLGSGGMGEVYRARDTRLGRDVAVKILPSTLTADPERLARFEREARVLAALNHPNIATIYGVEESAEAAGDVSRPAIVMELVDGETLADRIVRSRTGVPCREALAIGRQLVDALDAAHERGIVHRDLKPANIKVTTEGAVKVLDFGLAKTDAADGAGATHVDSLSHSPTVMVTATREGVILGTAAYMSPEQARGRSLDKRADVWAFGCVLYEMLTARRAFAGETVTDILAAVIERDPDWSALPADTPSGVRRLLARCLEKDPKTRLRDIGDARLELDEPVAVASSLPGRSDAGPSRRRERLAWGVAAVSFIAAVAALALVLPRAPGAVSASAPRIVRTIKVTNTPDQEFGAAIAPDGKWIAYYANANERTDLWVKFLDSGSMLNLTSALKLDLPVRAALGGVDISPDGTAIAFSARQTTEGNPALDTWVIPAPVGGTPRKIAQGIQAPRWSPDGTQLVGMMAGAAAGDSIWIVNSDGSSPREVLPRRGARHAHFPTWSRDGRFIYYIATTLTSHDEPSEVWRVPVAGGDAAAVIRSNRRGIYPAPLPDASLLFVANPASVDAGVWWQAAREGSPVALSNGVGEHSELYVSPDGRHALTTLQELRQSLIRLSVSFDGAPEEHAVTSGYAGDLYPVIDVVSQRLGFSSLRSGNRNLWLTRVDGSEAMPITSATALDERPAFSPDGKQIAFVSDRAQQRGVWVVGVDGGTPRLLAETVVLDTLTWSPDGKRILFARPGPILPELASLSVADGKIDRFATAAAASSPAWSAATGQIAYLEPSAPTATAPSRTYLTVIDATGRRLLPELPKTVTFQNGFVAWAPDGKRLAAVSVQANLRAAIWIVEPGGAMPFRRLIEFPVNVRPRGITWTPDGGAVIVGKQESTSDIVLFDLAQ